MKGILGKKVGMTQVFDEEGMLVPVTVIKAGPCVVLEVRTVENNGYSAVQLGFDDRSRNAATKPQIGLAKKAGTEPKKFIREIRDMEGEYKVGDVVGVDLMDGVEYVDVTGVTKGRGFAGVMKRWGFGGYPDSHGAEKHRGPGSIGQASDPSRVFKGLRMAGHMGSVKRTVKRLKVVKIDSEKNVMLVKGAVPGPVGGYLVIRENRRRSDG